MKDQVKLGLEDIASYLPYKLMVQTPIGLMRMDSLEIDRYTVWCKRRGLKDKINGPILDKESCCGRGFRLSEIKPILRPMDDLLNHNGRTPLIIRDILNIMDFDNYGGYYTSYVIENDSIKVYIWGQWVVTLNTNLAIMSFKYKVSTSISFDMSLRIVKILDKHHFDYRGLIEKGLAIDRNTLQGYK